MDFAYAEDFKKTKSDRRKSTLKDLSFHLDQNCSLLNTQPKPRNYKDFYLKFKTLF